MSEYDIEKMDFKQLREEVLYLRDELAKLKRTFEDVMYNLDDENFATTIVKEKQNMKSEIKIAADEISTKVSEEDLEGRLINYSTITQTATEINTKVSHLFADNIPTVTNASQCTNKDLMYFVTSQDKYYFYNTVTEEWEATNDNNVYSAFRQTSNGFELTGSVAIDGSLIATGKISGDRLEANRLYSRTDNQSYYAKIESSIGDFGIYSNDASTSATPANVNCMWGLYNGIDGVSFYINGNQYLYRGLSGTMHPVGDWDFSGCTSVEGLSAVAVFG